MTLTYQFFFLFHLEIFTYKPNKIQHILQRSKNVEEENVQEQPVCNCRSEKWISCIIPKYVKLIKKIRIVKNTDYSLHSCYIYQKSMYTCIRGGSRICGQGGVNRRRVWGPHTVPSGSRAEPRQGAQGGQAPGSSGGLRNYRHLFERQF